MKNIFLLIFILFFLNIFAEEISFSEKIDAHILETYQTEYNVKKIRKPGEPNLPYKVYRFVLPFGCEISNLNVLLGEFVELENTYEIKHNQKPCKFVEQSEFINTNPEIYETNKNYPYIDYELKGVHRLAGVDIAFIAVYPYKYNPVSKKISYSKKIDIKIETNFNPEIRDEQSHKICLTEINKNRIKRLVENYQMIDSYPLENTPSYTRDLVDPDNPSNFLIITSEEFTEICETYSAWKNGIGLSSVVYTVEDIYSEYIEGDNAQKIKDFIVDAYEVWANTDNPLEFVLLAGDDEVIPVRTADIPNISGVEAVPSELYFSCLDGSWDPNNNGIYAEINEDYDIVPEIHVGRFTCDEEVEFVNIMEKIFSYVLSENEYLNKATMVGNWLRDNPLVWGGDMKDQVIPIFPEDYTINTLYERDQTFSTVNLVNNINNNTAFIMNHVGHCNSESIMYLNHYEISHLSNTEYPFLYSQGCYTLAFDEEASGQIEAAGEQFILNECGLMGFIGNTRYGWYDRYNIYGGASHLFDVSFFQNVFTESIRGIGVALTYSRDDYIDELDDISMKYVYYELMLAGDPQIPIKNANDQLPQLSFTEIYTEELIGNGDSILSPGEKHELCINVSSYHFFLDASDLIITLSTDSTGITIENDTFTYDYLAAGDHFSNENNPFIIDISESRQTDTIFFNLHLEANSGTEYFYEKDYSFDLDVSWLVEGYPLHQDDEFIASPCWVDLNGDDENEVIIASASTFISAMSDNTNPLDGFPLVCLNIKKDLTIGDFDGNGDNEIIVNQENNNVLAVSYFGEEIFQTNNYDFSSPIPVISDINDDNINELIVVSLNTIDAININGESISGFPVTISREVQSNLLIGDIDNDTQKEIVFSDIDGLLYSLENDGSISADYPIALQNEVKTPAVIYNNNNDFAISDEAGVLYLISNGNIFQQIDLGCKIVGSIIVSNFDEDPELELAFALENGLVFIMKQNTEFLFGYPLAIANTISEAPVSCDLNEDGINDLIICDDEGSIWGFDSFGNYLPKFPLQTGYNLTSSLTIADMDNSGNIEIMVGTDYGVYAWDLHQGIINSSSWLTAGYNYQRTYNINDETNTALVNPEVQSVNSKINKIYPNPFVVINEKKRNQATKINFSVSEEDSKHPIEICVYNLKGQKVSTLHKGLISEGSHIISWNGRTVNDKESPSGMYFFKLNTYSNSFIKKVVVVK